MSLQKYIGRMVEIIYLDRRNQITKRTVMIRAVDATHIKAYCHAQKGPRVFKIENILAVMPVVRRAV